MLLESLPSLAGICGKSTGVEVCSYRPGAHTNVLEVFEAAEKRSWLEEPPYEAGRMLDVQ
jgi:hypothetical protein